MSDSDTTTDSREPTGEVIDTTPYINYSATERERYTVEAELTITLPVANDRKSGYIGLMWSMSLIDDVQFVELEGFDHTRVRGDDAPDPQCPVPNLPDPEENREAFAAVIRDLQNAVNRDEGHDPFEGTDISPEQISDTDR